MFKVSEATNLAVHAMAYLVSLPEDTSTPTAAIAKRLGCSPSHLAKVLNGLAGHGMLISSRGAKGGFRVAGPHGSLTALDVFEAVDGGVPDTGCALGKPICKGEPCVFQNMFADFREQFVSRLNEVRLVDIHVKS